jgi:nondiscriminating glutamyl-tRNA synthetase
MTLLSSPKVRVRFAPSPTGPLHIGGARSALFNYLLARKYGGNFVVRIEDTDLERSSRESEENILESLRWLGIEWDEGIGVGGKYAPYRQTERLDTYERFAQQLLDNGHAYYCYCTEEELEAERKVLLDQEELVQYQGKCRFLSNEDRERLQAEGRKPALRFIVPDDQTVVVKDLVRGDVAFDTSTMGDFVIMKSDGIPVYNFACVIDDVLMEISHVIRGEEHLSNTPRQLLIYDALGLSRPLFAHVSLILGTDRTKMSKRHGTTSVVAYREAGYLPEALINFLVLLGWSPPGEQEILSLKEISEYFSLDRVAKNPAVFDLDKLKWVNGCYIRQSSLEHIADLAVPHLQKAGIFQSELTAKEYSWVKLLVEAVRDRISCIAEIVDEAHAFLQEKVLPENEEAQGILLEEQVAAVAGHFRQKIEAIERDEIPLDVPQVKALLKQITKETKLNGRKVYMPLRVLLTGKIHGSELYYVIPLLGVKGCLARLESLNM